MLNENIKSKLSYKLYFAEHQTVCSRNFDLYMYISKLKIKYFYKIVHQGSLPDEFSRSFPRQILAFAYSYSLKT